MQFHIDKIGEIKTIAAWYTNSDSYLNLSVYDSLSKSLSDFDRVVPRPSNIGATLAVFQSS